MKRLMIRETTTREYKPKIWVFLNTTKQEIEAKQIYTSKRQYTRLKVFQDRTVQFKSSRVSVRKLIANSVFRSEKVAEKEYTRKIANTLMKLLEQSVEIQFTRKYDFSENKRDGLIENMREIKGHIGN